MADTDNLGLKKANDLSNSDHGSDFLDDYDTNMVAIDGRIKRATGTLAVASWSGSAAPYTQSIAVTDLLATQVPVVDLDLSAVAEADRAAKITDWALIERVYSSAGYVNFEASEIPTEALPVVIVAVI